MTVNEEPAKKAPFEAASKNSGRIADDRFA